jgi:hypothetical protein
MRIILQAFDVIHQFFGSVILESRARIAQISHEVPNEVND